MHVLPTSNVKFSESQVNHTFLGIFCLLFRKFALKQGQNFGADAPYREGWGSSPIFVRGCATWGSRTPPFEKARQRRNFDSVLRQILEKVSKKCLKMYDSLEVGKTCIF